MLVNVSDDNTCTHTWMFIGSNNTTLTYRIHCSVCWLLIWLPLQRWWRFFGVVNWKPHCNKIKYLIFIPSVCIGCVAVVVTVVVLVVVVVGAESFQWGKCFFMKVGVLFQSSGLAILSLSSLCSNVLVAEWVVRPEGCTELLLSDSKLPALLEKAHYKDKFIHSYQPGHFLWDGTC